MTKKRYVVARNEWCARRLLAKVYNGTAPKACLFPNQGAANKRISNMRMVEQARYRVFEVEYEEPKETGGLRVPIGTKK